MAGPPQVRADREGPRRPGGLGRAPDPVGRRHRYLSRAVRLIREGAAVHPSEAVAVQEAFARRVGPGEALMRDAEAVSRACHDMALRFHSGGKLIVFGNGPTATDAQHVVVEFVHPVIVGKRALPAISLTSDTATVTGIARSEGFDTVFATQLRLLASPADIALGLSVDGGCANVREGLRAARGLGLLTVALLGAGGGQIGRDALADHTLVVHAAI